MSGDRDAAAAGDDPAGDAGARCAAAWRPALVTRFPEDGDAATAAAANELCPGDVSVHGSGYSNRPSGDPIDGRRSVSSESRSDAGSRARNSATGDVVPPSAPPAPSAGAVLERLGGESIIDREDAKRRANPSNALSRAPVASLSVANSGADGMTGDTTEGRSGEGRCASDAVRVHVAAADGSVAAYDAAVCLQHTQQQVSTRTHTHTHPTGGLMNAPSLCAPRRSQSEHWHRPIWLP